MTRELEKKTINFWNVVVKNVWLYYAERFYCYVFFTRKNSTENSNSSTVEVFFFLERNNTKRSTKIIIKYVPS